METITTDILVIGSGAAGLNFAINSCKHCKVTVVTKKELFKSNTNLAQGGIAAVMSPEDDFSKHIKDTLKTGIDICNKEAVKIMVREAPKQILQLIELGVNFTKKGKVLAMSKEAGHGMARIVHARDATGRAIEQAFVSATKQSKIKVLENTVAYELIMSSERCKGARVIDSKENKIISIQSKATILATGGMGQLYKHNTNPAISTGDGFALAYEAGAELEDLEFIQFHPTKLEIDPDPNFLISETVRGEGGHLVNFEGKRFMKKYHPKQELAPRDIVARAIMLEKKKGKVYLDISHKEPSFIKERFPTIYRKCKKLGIDITKNRIPIIPAAHYICGGIKTNTDGETSIPGLYAFGETACTGVHGANRLASNSLLESLVFSERAFRSSLEYIKKVKIVKLPESEDVLCSPYGKAKAAKKIKHRVRKIMWENVGIVRNTDGLSAASKKLHQLEQTARKLRDCCLSKDVVEALNMAVTGRLITESALMRKESRGTHYLEDNPDTKGSMKKHFSVKKS